MSTSKSDASAAAAAAATANPNDTSAAAATTADAELLARRIELLAVSAPAAAATTTTTEQPGAAEADAEEDGDSADADEEDLPADAEAAVRKTLVLIDFNEFLVFRDKKRAVRAAKADFRAGRATTFNFYVRPGAMEFVAQLAQDPRCEFAIYTSMKRANMLEFAHAFDEFQAGRGSAAMRPVPCGATGVTTTTASSLARGGLAIFDRPFNVPDRTPGKDAWDTVRDLSLIFDVPAVRDRGYSAANTVLIEAEGHKIGRWAANSVQPAAFTAATINNGGGSDDELFRLGESLQAAFTAMQAPGAAIPRVLAATAYPAFAPTTAA